MPPADPLRTDHLLLRPWRSGDEESLVEHANDRRVSIQLRDRFPYPYTMEDARQWISVAEKQAPVTSFAIEVGGCAVGGIGLIVGEDVFRRSAELGYWLGVRLWGQGLMTEAVRLVTEHGFEQMDLVRNFAGVFESNPASARVLEKAGYTLESRMRKAAVKEGRILDQLLYVRVR